jgi:hypothetical protein
MHALNLALRFALEIAALWGIAVFAAGLGAGWMRFVYAALAVVAAATVWGVFAVPDDPSRSGGAPVPVPGAVRLALELAVLFGGAAAFWLIGRENVALVMAGLVVLHYALWPARIAWLLGG